jgi:hypothetical protein
MSSDIRAAKVIGCNFLIPLAPGVFLRHHWFCKNTEGGLYTIKTDRQGAKSELLQLKAICEKASFDFKSLKKLRICGKRARSEVSRRSLKEKNRWKKQEGSRFKSGTGFYGGSIHTWQKRDGQDQILHRCN